MRRTYFGISFVLLVIVQMILCNYFQFTPLVTLTILPAMVLCIPLSINTPICMLMAFGAGLTVDILAEGLIGLNTAAILPIAFGRKTLMSIFLGEDLVARGDRFSFKKNGIEKISAALAISYAVFFIFYIALDGAGIRPFWFNVIRFIFSLVLSMILGMITVSSLTYEERK